MDTEYTAPGHVAPIAGFIPTRDEYEQMAAKIAEQAATIARLEAELKTANELAVF